MKRILCLFLAALLPLSLTACADWDELAEDPLQELSSYYQSENESREASELTSFSLPYCETETLDAVTCSDGFQQTVGSLLYESLYEPDESFEMQNVLAQSCQYDAVNLTYTIQIRSGVRFSDGSALTATDVVDTLHRAAQSARYGSRFTKVGWISASQSKVIITMLEPNGGLPSLLDIPIVKSGTENQKIPLGTGPYAVAKEENGSHYLAPNPYWWQNKRLPLNRIDLVSCKTVDAANYAFTAQNVQLLCTDLVGTDATPADVSGVCTDAPGTVMQYLGFNLRNETLADSAVRQAISAAIDRNTLVRAYLLGHGTAAQFPLPPQSTFYPTEAQSSYSREAADAAMQKAGLKSGEEKVELTFLVNEENHFKLTVATQIAEALNRYNLAVTVQALPWEEYLSALQSGQYDLYFGETKLRPDWDLSALIGTGGALNYGGFSNEDTDLLLSEFLETQGESRRAVMSELCDDFLQNQPIAPICFKAVSVLVTNRAVDKITPIAANPFYHMENWTVHLSES